MEDLPGTEEYVVYRNPKQVYQGIIQPSRVLHNGKHIQCSIATLEAGQVIHRESHPQDQAILVLSGTIAVQDASGSYDIVEGQTAVIPGHLQHKVIHRGAGTVKTVTFYSPRAHEGETYSWPEEDEPLKRIELRPDQRVYVFDPIRALLSHKEAFQTDVVCTSHMSIGIATVLSVTEYLEGHLTPRTLWNREGFYFVISGNGRLKVDTVSEPVATHDLVYCAGMESEFSDYRFKADKTSVSNVHSNALYLVYYTSTRHADQLRPPLACWRADDVESVDVDTEPSILHAATEPSPLLLDVFAEEKGVPQEVSSAIHGSLLEQIRLGKTLRKVEQTTAERNTNVLQEQISEMLSRRRKYIRTDLDEQDSDEYEDEYSE